MEGGGSENKEEGSASRREGEQPQHQVFALKSASSGPELSAAPKGGADCISIASSLHGLLGPLASWPARPQASMSVSALLAGWLARAGLAPARRHTRAAQLLLEAASKAE